MGSKETDKLAKESKDDSTKETPTSQEQSSGNAAGEVQPDWTAFQAYSPMPPHGYLASSPQPHPYMWGVQHLMPPYGTPPHPYVAMYPHGGLYAHPSMPPGSYPYSPYPMPSPNGVPEASVSTPGSMEVNGKSPEGKEKLPIKRSKGSLGSLNMITGKNNESGKAGASANGSYPKSGESGSEDSSEGSDANSENNSQIKSGSRQDSMEGEATQNGNSVHGSQNGRPNTYDSVINQSMAVVPMSATVGPTTNLNISMVAAGSRGNMQPQPWLQDDRELKRQRRKLSNRESARRSRLRKQAECDDLAQRADSLKEENASLKAEVSHIRRKYEQLLAENASLKGSPLPLSRAGFETSRGRSCIAKASSDDSGRNLVPVAPLQLESPVGQLLEQILQTHPHLLPAAIDQQLENLQNERDAQKEEAAPSSTDSLYKRIAEVKEKDRQKVLEEIMYCWIVQKFVEKEISMIPKLTATDDPTGRVDYWPNQEMKLESVHSAEALEMIQNHVALVLGDRVVGPLESIVQISKIKLGKLYAASIMYGYFLKRVDERFQLERSMNTLPKGFTEGQSSFAETPVPQSPFWDPDSLIRIQPDYDVDEEGFMRSSGDDGQSYRLRSYVMYLDAETLQRYATIRSKEAISLIERQTQALFGRPDIKISEDGSLGASNDEVVNLTFSGLTMLVLEAVAFGSFLWDGENYIEAKYQFIKS